MHEPAREGPAKVGFQTPLARGIRRRPAELIDHLTFASCPGAEAIASLSGRPFKPAYLSFSAANDDTGFFATRLWVDITAFWP